MPTPTEIAMQKIREEWEAPLRARIFELEAALLSVYSLATTELRLPTELHMTCLSLIQKQVEQVLDLSKYAKT